MPGKKRSASADQELKATVKKLRTKLASAEAKVERHKKKTARLERSLSDSESQVKKLKKAAKRAGKQEHSAPVAEVSTADAWSPSAAASSTVDSAAPDAGPDASWTVIQLRAEARSRGLTGLSGKPKAELLAALT